MVEMMSCRYDGVAAVDLRGGRHAYAATSVLELVIARQFRQQSLCVHGMAAARETVCAGSVPLLHDSGFT